MKRSTEQETRHPTGGTGAGGFVSTGMSGTQTLPLTFIVHFFSVKLQLLREQQS